MDLPHGPRSAASARRGSAGLLAVQGVVLVLPIVLTALSQSPDLALLARRLAANPGGYLLGFVLLGFPVWFAMWLTIFGRQRPEWRRPLWFGTIGMGIIAIAICGSAGLMSDTSAALSFAWPLTALVQLIALAMFGVMWWIFRVIARANHP
jgi:hypothetical protein